MKHLYEIHEQHELYAADTLEDAVAFFRLCAEQEPDFARQIPDDEPVKIFDDDRFAESQTRTAAEWAAMHDTVAQAASTYL